MSAMEGSAWQDQNRASAPQERRIEVAPRQAPVRGVNFGIALAAAKAGAKITRHGWNGKGMWLRHFDPYTDTQFRVREEPSAEGTWLPFLIMKTADNKLVPWLASQTDILADDWQVIP